MRPILLLLVVMSWTLHIGDAWSAGRIQCDAVLSMAEVEADPAISVVVAKDPGSKTCVFYVSMPPGAGPRSALQETSDIFRSLLITPDDKAVFEQFVPVATRALLYPLTDTRLDKEKVQIWSEILTKQNMAINDCAFEAVWKKSPFRRLNEVISCGIADDGSRFVVEAELDGLTLALFLPFT